MNIIESNLLSFFLNLRHWDQAELYIGPGMWFSRTDINHPIFNAVHHCRLRLDEADENIERIKALGKPVIWRVWPSTDPADMAERLESAGFVDHGAAIGMARSIGEWWTGADLAGLRFTTIKTERNLTEWVDVFTEGYAMPDFLRVAYLDYYTQLLKRGVPLYHFLGWCDDRPVCAGSLWVDNKTAGIYNLTTLPDSRRQGYATAMSYWLLSNADYRGCLAAVLQAAPDAVGLYDRLGFEEFCEIGHYVYEP